MKHITYVKASLEDKTIVRHIAHDGPFQPYEAKKVLARKYGVQLNSIELLEVV